MNINLNPEKLDINQDEHNILAGEEQEIIGYIKHFNFDSTNYHPIATFNIIPIFFNNTNSEYQYIRCFMILNRNFNKKIFRKYKVNRKTVASVQGTYHPSKNTFSTSLIEPYVLNVQERKSIEKNGLTFRNERYITHIFNIVALTPIAQLMIVQHAVNKSEARFLKYIMQANSKNNNQPIAMTISKASEITDSNLRETIQNLEYLLKERALIKLKDT